MRESFEASLVRIHTPDGHVVGAGFLVSERHILTCAHVVAGALDLADDTAEKPQTSVSLDIPRVAPGKLLTAHVVLWQPPLPDGGDDLAGLELEGDLPHGAKAASLSQVEDLWEHSFRAFGFPRGQDTGVWATGRLLGRQLTNWVQIEDVKETGFAVGPGFSGTPVWDPQVEAVVGMVVAAERQTNLKTAFAIPVDVLAKSWPLLESFIHPFVFLCYARADSELVTRLKADLIERFVHIWIDREGLQPGTIDWEEALRTAVRAARAVLLIASPNARSSRYVRDELRVAELYQRPVYPLWIAGAQWMDAVPLGWGGLQYLDARESRYESAVPELVALLDKASSKPPKAPELDFEPRNPYKGLRAFSGDDAHDFFGRDTLINELVTTLEGALASEEKNQQCARLLAVVGPSGSGKSSVVMAGLLPRLRECRLPGSEQWVYLDSIVPGTRPIEALTLALSEHLPDKSLKAIRDDLEDDGARGLHLLAKKLAKRPESKVVLLVDQFEELFTQTPSEDERCHFLDLLVTATTEPHGPVIVLLTLRADFYDRPMRYPVLHQLIQAHQTYTLPMGIQDLREVIEKPTSLPDVRLTFEGDLVGDLLFEVQGQVGALPLLQFTLDQLFQQRNGRLLTLSAYREMGGVKGALAKQAEETYVALPSDEHRKLARALFVRLIDPGASEQDTTRRRAALAEFSLADITQTHMLQADANAFIAARLLTTNEVAETTTIEVSHEALIREWPRLAGWLREAREDIHLQQTISKDAAEWEQRNKPGDRLYRGSQLKEAQAWARRNTPSSNEVAFLRSGAANRMRNIVSVTVIALLPISTTVLAGCLWFLSHNPLDPTHITNLQDDSMGNILYVIGTLLVQPFFLIGLLFLWAYPFAARFWRKRAVTDAQSGVVWLESEPGQAISLDRKPVQFRLALIIGITGALLFCGVMLAFRLWLRLSVPLVVREMVTFKLALWYWITSRAVVAQGIIAIVTAAWARRSGILLALLATFIGGCLITIGTLAINVLFGGQIDLDFTWIALSGIVISGVLLAVLLAPLTALLTKLIGLALRAALVGALTYCVLILCMTISWRFITLKPVTSDLYVSAGITLLVVFQVLVGAIVAGRSPRRGWLFGLFAACITGFVGWSITEPLATSIAIASFAQESSFILGSAYITVIGMLFALPVVLIVFFISRWIRLSRMRKNAGTPTTTKAFSP